MSEIRELKNGWFLTTLNEKTYASKKHSLIEDFLVAGSLDNFLWAQPRPDGWIFINYKKKNKESNNPPKKEEKVDPTELLKTKSFWDGLKKLHDVLGQLLVTEPPNVQ